MRVNDEFALLFARLDDLCDKAATGVVGVSDFLSPREAHYAEAFLRSRGARFFLWGGYAEAERRRIYILPDYFEEGAGYEQLAEYGFDGDIGAIRIITDGYRKLSHRDHMGSLLGLGVDRAVVGDILVCEDGGKEASVFCSAAMVGFFCDSLQKVATEKARAVKADARDVSIPERRTAEILDTVASPRLDCVVGAVCSLSRERAREAVVLGLVELDYESEERPDRAVSAPALLTVRGYGKYKIVSVCDKTKKGRYRLIAEKYL